MAFNYSPRVVTDGLVLYLDAANQYSYVSGSTSWNDISRGRNNGTLVNGPTSDALGDSLSVISIPPSIFLRWLMVHHVSQV